MADVPASSRALFEAVFSKPPTIAAYAPGRVNLIGEHTDYNGGFALPMAINRGTTILAAPNGADQLRVHAAQFGQDRTIPLAQWTPSGSKHWADYVAGVAVIARRDGYPITGADILIDGNVPLGCGLSSSASLEIAVITAFEALNGFALTGPDAASLGQRVENEFLGVQTGIMDQFVSRLARSGHALFIDCQSLEYTHIPLTGDDAVFVIANTGVSRSLASSKYNERVAECRDAVTALSRHYMRDAQSLRDFALDELEAAQSALDPVSYRRARHVLTENDRTRAACDALRSGELATMGSLMNASDHSLRDDYEVTCPELDAMTAIARSLPGCWGSRMTGAGFGGCTVSLVAADAAGPFATGLSDQFLSLHANIGDLLSTAPATGAWAIPLG